MFYFVLFPVCCDTFEIIHNNAINLTWTKWRRFVVRWYYEIPLWNCWYEALENFWNNVKSYIYIYSWFDELRGLFLTLVLEYICKRIHVISWSQIYTYIQWGDVSNMMFEPCGYRFFHEIVTMNNIPEKTTWNTSTNWPVSILKLTICRKHSCQVTIIITPEIWNLTKVVNGRDT